MKETNYYDFYEQYKRAKEAALKHGYRFHEWDINFKNIKKHAFSGKTARKTLSDVSFTDSFNGNELADIMQVGRAIFPQNIWVGTEKEKINDTKVLLTNINGDIYGKFINAFAFHDGGFRVHQALNKLGTSNAAISLCTFSEKDKGKKFIYSINAIAVKIDYKNSGFKNKNGKQKVLEILQKEHFDKTIPCPTYIVDEDKLVLVYVFDEPAYIYKHSKGIRFFEWMSKVFAQRIGYLGGMEMKANEPVFLPETAVCLGYDRIVRCTAKWISCGSKISHKNLHTWLTPIDELKEEKPWYRTEKEGGRKKKIRKWNPTFSEHNKEVLCDLVTIREFYNENGIVWHNKTLLFIYAVFAKKVFGKENLEAAVYEFSKGFNVPCNEDVIKGAINSNLEKDYNYKNETILSILGVADNTDIFLKMREAKNKRAEYIKDWKNKKSEIKKKEKEDKKQRLYASIKKLRKQGKKNLEILSMLIKHGFEISFKTLERYITALIKTGDVVARTA